MQTVLIIIGIIVSVMVILVLRAKARMKNIPLVPDNPKILTLNEKNFNHQTKNKVVLVDFWAAWCGPCRVMAPVLNEVASELNGNKYIGKINVEEHQSLASKYKIRGIPTMILFKNGKEVNRFMGVRSKDALIKLIESA